MTALIAEAAEQSVYFFVVSITMNIKEINLPIRAIVVVLLAAAFAAGQNSVQVNERDVRAEMYFLASDAMQGRGSGTGYEHIAAEYIGSQFMQFGLEPAGDAGFDGKPTFVQTVNIVRNTFAEAPTISYYDKVATHGKEMLVLRTNTGEVTGGLQFVAPGQTPRSEAAVVMRSKDTDDPRASMQAAQAMLNAGAAIVFIEETPAIRANWANFASRMPAFTTTNARPAVMLVVTKDLADALAGEADGLAIKFGGKLAEPQVSNTWNAIGKVTGSDPKLGSEVILLTSHLDHLGVKENNPGNDKIFNGADDDASGSVAVLELARSIGAGKRPKRTVYFVCFGSEESGGFGANYFVNNLPFAKDKLAANLEFEMIGRPDGKVKPEELWLTGYDRSNLGPELAKRGAKLVQDPHPEENFFQRSDNYTLARQGIIAHTVSSYGLHKDYHHASDEVKTIDFAHMTRAINSMVSPVEWLINSDFVPKWNDGMKP